MPTPAPTPEQLAKFMQIDRDRKLAQSTADSLKKEQDLLSGEFRAWLAAKGKNSLARGKFMVSLIEGNRYPPWKDEFIKQLGNDAAEALKESTPRATQINVMLKDAA